MHDDSREGAATGRQHVLSDVRDFFNEFVSGLGDLPASGARSPRYDLAGTDAEYTVLIDVPGMPKESLDVKAEGDELRISGDRPPPVLPDGAEILRSERGVGRFSRTIRLPSEVDVTAVRAKLDAGVLRITLPRRGGGGTKNVDIEV